MTGTIHMLVGDTILETRQYHSLKEQQLIIFAFKKMGASAVQVVPKIKQVNGEGSHKLASLNDSYLWYKRYRIQTNQPFLNYHSWMKNRTGKKKKPTPSVIINSKTHELLVK